jgi:hypothetical protein
VVSVDLYDNQSGALGITECIGNFLLLVAHA